MATEAFLYKEAIKLRLQSSVADSTRYVLGPINRNNVWAYTWAGSAVHGSVYWEVNELVKLDLWGRHEES